MTSRTILAMLVSGCLINLTPKFARAGICTEWMEQYVGHADLISTITMYGKFSQNMNSEKVVIGRNTSGKNTLEIKFPLPRGRQLSIFHHESANFMTLDVLDENNARLGENEFTEIGRLPVVKCELGHGLVADDGKLTLVIKISLKSSSIGSRPPSIRIGGDSKPALSAPPENHNLLPTLGRPVLTTFQMNTDDCPALASKVLNDLKLPNSRRKNQVFVENKTTKISVTCSGRSVFLSVATVDDSRSHGLSTTIEQKLRDFVKMD